jgi:uncharacterized protein YlxW (UPF0749 family)
VSSQPHRSPYRLRVLASRLLPSRDRAASGTDGVRRHSLAWRLATPLVGLLVGVLFVVSAHSSEGTDLRPGRYTDLASLVRSDAARVDALRQRVADLNSQVSLLSGSVDNRQVTHFRRLGARMEGPAGLLPMSGAGVTVTLSDAPQGTSSDTPDTVDNPNLLLVHQQDIQAVVNAMWKGGAQAVTIQGQRVVSTTGIRCIGNSVQLQGVPYSQPYVISAIGDPAALQRAIADDAYLQVYRQDAENPDINVGWEEVVQTHISAPAYDGLVDMRYAHPLPASAAGSAR